MINARFGMRTFGSCTAVVSCHWQGLKAIDLHKLNRDKRECKSRGAGTQTTTKVQQTNMLDKGFVSVPKLDRYVLEMYYR